MATASSTGSLDPVTVQVTRHRLEGIANEMQATLLLLAHREAGAGRLGVYGDPASRATAARNADRANGKVRR